MSFVTGILLTIWFWLPAIAETKYGQMGSAFTEGYFNYSNHFRGLNLVQRTPIFNYSVAGTLDAAGPFAMGLIQALLTLGGCAAIALAVWRRLAARARGDASLPRTGRPIGPRSLPAGYLPSAHLAGLLLSTFMVTPLSAILWDKLPLLALTQFPWRFLSIQALFTAILAGAIVEPMPGLETRIADADVSAQPYRRRPYMRRALALVAGAPMVAAGLLGLHPDRLAISPGDVTWENLRLYETFTGNIGTTIRYEYLPAAVVPRLYISEAVIDGAGSLRTVDVGDLARPGLVDAPSGPVSSRLVASTPVKQTWSVTVPDASTSVAFPVNWWPGWTATVDGALSPSYAVAGSGRLAVDLTPGSHSVTLRLQATPLERIASLGSLGSVMLAAVAMMWAGGWRRHVRKSGLGMLPRGAGIAVGVLGAALIGPLFLQPGVVFGQPAAGEAVFFDFDQMPYPHRGPVAYGDLHLESVRLSTETARPGQDITTDLVWDASPTEPVTVTLRAVSPAEPRHGVDIAVAQVTGSLAAPSRLTLTLPDDLSRGLYLVQLRVTGHRGEIFPTTAEGHTMGPLYVGVLRVPEGPPLGDVPVLAEFEDLDLLAVATEQPQPETLRLKMSWSLRLRQAGAETVPCAQPAAVATAAEPCSAQSESVIAEAGECPIESASAAVETGRCPVSSAATARNWRLSLRVLDLNGRLLAQQDLQPGYGYLPTTLWEPGQLVVDTVVVPLPEGLAPGNYTLQVVTYLQATMEGGGQTDLPLRLDTPTLYDLRDACCEQTRKGATILCQNDEVALLGLDAPDAIQEGESLHLQAEWNALLQPTEDVSATWTLTDARGDAVGTTTAPLAPGSTTSEWPRHTWALSPITVDLPARLTEGAYLLGLTLTGEASGVTACGPVATVHVAARPRLFAAPTVSHPEHASFGAEASFGGDTIRLLGYDTASGAQQLTLTLWWQAAATPSQDYKRFVHLYAPQTETVVAQSDAMPRDWTYPTTLWMAGEVVSETVTLDLAKIPEGTYRLGVGWYDPETGDRLTAVTPDPQATQANRVTLGETVHVAP